ncbi:hypothetical protein [uncultured Amnibacterium sp.]|uniref:hypothetical protein n=1 Tax=uncultured Amnibacterium sp. TaxID=1631851 RepID=UPI0035CB84B9
MTQRVPAEDLPIRIISGSPTDEETAAIAALFSRLLIEQAVSSTPLQEDAAGSDQVRTRRALRVAWPARTGWRDR